MIYDLKKFDEIILRDPHNYAVFSSLTDSEVYIVGGYLRDVMLGKRVMDRDYVVRGELSEITAGIAAKTGGRVINMGKKNLYRILLKDGITMDFTLINDDIEKDLSERDFTINAMAWSPRTGLIDSFGGAEDINNGLISAINEENLSKDPVRIIRAYRISGETSFVIDEKTQQILKRIGNKIRQAKRERITLEFFRILNLYDPFLTLKAMLGHKVLTCIICLSNSKLIAKLKVLNDLNRIIYEKSFKHSLEVDNIISQNLSYKGLLRLEALLMGSPATSLNLSSKIRKKIMEVERANYAIKDMKGDEYGAFFDAFRLAGSASLDFLILNNLMKKMPDLIRFKKLQKKSLLAVHEITDIINAGKGPILGKAKEFLLKAEFTGKIRTKREAIESIKINFSNYAS